MATVALTTTPTQIDDGTAYTVLVTNAGAVPVDLSRGGRLRPGQTATVYPEGTALTAAATSGTGSVTTSTTTKPLPNPSDPAALAARPEFSGTYAQFGTSGYDLILLLGQSNMSGRGTPYDTTRYDVSDPRIFQFGASGAYASVVSQAVEPLAMHDTPTGIGPGLHFARWYRDTTPTQRRVLLVPSAHGATQLSTNSTPLGWRNGVSGNLSAQAIAQAKAALAAAGPNSQIVAALWIQGESDGDASVSGATYQTDLDALIDGIRTGLALPALPFVIGQMVPDYLTTGTRAAINTVHAATPARKTRTAFAYGFPGMTMSDGNHYNAAAQRVLARSMFDQFQALTGKTTAPTTPGQVTGLAVGTPASTIPLTWTAVAGALAYLVEYRTSPAGTWTTSAGVTGTSATVTGLTFSTAYDFRVTAYNSAGAGTASSTVTATTAGPVVSDTFTRADSSTTLGSADSGQAWSAVSGTWGISSNQAYAPVAANAVAEINSGISDCTVSVKLSVLAAANQQRMIFRGDGTTSNYWMLQYRQSTAKYQLHKNTGGTFTQVGSDLSNTPTVNDVVAVVLSGSSITVQINGVTAVSVTDTANQSGTYHGLGMSAADANARFDNFLVYL